jgi:hypothetical protein
MSRALDRSVRTEPQSGLSVPRPLERVYLDASEQILWLVVERGADPQSAIADPASAGPLAGWVWAAWRPDGPPGGSAASQGRAG